MISALRGIVQVAVHLCGQYGSKEGFLTSSLMRIYVKIVKKESTVMPLHRSVYNDDEGKIIVQRLRTRQVRKRRRTTSPNICKDKCERKHSDAASSSCMLCSAVCTTTMKERIPAKIAN